jgi:hypothetical protein
VAIGLARPGQSAALGSEGSAHLGDTLGFVVVAFNRRAEGVGTVRVTIPKGFSLVAGDTVLDLPPVAGNRPTTLRVRPTRAGQFSFRAVLHIARGEEIDEAETVLPVTVREDTVIIGQKRPIRVETVVDGQRYRCWGEWMVPIDGPEPVIEWEIVKARAIKSPAALCSACPFSGVDTVAFIAIIDKRGVVSHARPLPLGQATPLTPDSVSVAAARSALARWKFAPATFEGRALNDWQFVRVPIRKPK